MPSAPYDTVETAIQTARVRVNDAIASLAGDILTDTQAFTQTLVNAAWRRLQEYLSDKGVAALNRDVILTAVPAVGFVDQGAQAWFNWANYFNGGLLGAPVFPQDMIAPLALEERVSGTQINFTPMDQVFAPSGLPTIPKGPLNRLWEWRQETIYMPGATGATDIRLRYAGSLSDFATVGPTQWFSQPIPISRALNSLSWYICFELCIGRGDMDVVVFEQKAQAAAEQIFNREYRAERALFKGSELGKMADPRTPELGPAGARGPQKAA